jgi:hypothetical protein
MPNTILVKPNPVSFWISGIAIPWREEEKEVQLSLRQLRG